MDLYNTNFQKYNGIEKGDDEYERRLWKFKRRNNNETEGKPLNAYIELIHVVKLDKWIKLSPSHGDIELI